MAGSRLNINHPLNQYIQDIFGIFKHFITLNTVKVRFLTLSFVYLHHLLK